jgi:hypothetical protein
MPLGFAFSAVTAIVLLSLFLAPRFGICGMLAAAGGVQLCFNNS